MGKVKRERENREKNGGRKRGERKGAREKSNIWLMRVSAREPDRLLFVH